MSILPSQYLEDAIKQSFIVSNHIIPNDNIQPASLDLRLGSVAWRIAASFLPSSQESVREKIQNVQMHECDLSHGFVFEKGCVYIVPLQESLQLPDFLYGRANPKSSTGRLDVFARVLTEYGDVFDDIPQGYQGQLYVEIAPRTFSIRVRQGDRLVQLRLLDKRFENTINNQLVMNYTSFTVDVKGGLINEMALYQATNWPKIIGWRARKHAGLIDLSLIKHYPVLDFWEPVFARAKGGVILDPDDFYILATNENIEIPNNMAAEMLAYDTAFGEFRVHYAGFFDPGFGWGDNVKARGVLEVRTHEVPFLITENQVVGRLSFLPMIEIPQKIYGQSLGSNYQGQTLSLAKQFASF
jgi:dCTP deaminase